jgi:FKBP-type peptidyl-prolyl cis-trans isomerase FkpA
VSDAGAILRIRVHLRTKALSNRSTIKEHFVKHAFIAALVALSALGCAYAQPATPNCTPPPKELVTKDVLQGKGDTAVFRSGILVQYTGWLYDGCAKDLKGEQFDSSQGRSTPFGFILGAGKVIKGWDEGVLGMKVGGKRMLVIPPGKAYGERGAGTKIPPDATLVFDVELVAIPIPPPGAAPKPQ